MTKGIALNIGLNSVDPKCYEGWSGPLNACEADANDIADLARAQGFSAAKLLTKKATRGAVLKGIASAARKLKSGDIFLLSYSGHGGQVPDLNGEVSTEALLRRKAGTDQSTTVPRPWLREFQKVSAQ